jgi:hypothetical protein
MKYTPFLRLRVRTVLRTMAVAMLVPVFGGCGGTAQLFTGDGRPTTQVQCPTAGPWDTCLQNARGICQGDVDVIKRSSSGETHTLLFACRAK